MKKLLHGFSMILLSLFAFNCSDDNLVADQKMESKIDNIHQSSRGPISLLKVDPKKDPTLQLQKGKKIVSKAVELIEEDKGGEIKFEDDLNGKAKVKFEKHTVSQDMDIELSWAKKKYQGSLEPKDKKNKNEVLLIPVKLELEFKRAFLGHTNTDNLIFCVKNPDTKKWEVVDAEIDVKDLKIKTELTSFGKFGLFEKDDENLTDIFRLGKHRHYASKYIKAKKGGKIKIGDKEDGESELEFPKYALPEDLTILFDWTASGTFEGTLNNMEFGPHGTYFNQPVEVKLSYKMADLTDVVEEDLRVYYFNEDLQEWEFIGGEVDVKKKRITVYLNHFSRYAVAYAR